MQHFLHRLKKMPGLVPVESLFSLLFVGAWILVSINIFLQHIWGFEQVSVLQPAFPPYRFVRRWLLVRTDHTRQDSFSLATLRIYFWSFGVYQHAARRSVWLPKDGVGLGHGRLLHICPPDKFPLEGALLSLPYSECVDGSNWPSA